MGDGYPVSGAGVNYVHLTGAEGAIRESICLAGDSIAQMRGAGRVVSVNLV